MKWSGDNASDTESNHTDELPMSLIHDDQILPLEFQECQAQHYGSIMQPLNLGAIEKSTGGVLGPRT
jgi:hypothetical protein